MKQFFKFLFASCLGTFFALGLLTFVGIGSIANMSKKSETVVLKPNSVLKLSLGKAIPEKTNNVASNSMSFDFKDEKILGLNDILKALSAAKEDDNIKGIYLQVKQPQAGMATMSRLRKGIEDFKESGKFVVAYDNYYSQGNYYLASVADKVYVNPVGGVAFNGFAAQIPFFKDMLDRLGVDMQVLYAGKFKSATEPFRRNSMSPENKTQTREYLSEYYNNFLADIGKSRNLSVATLKQYSDEMKIRDAQDAVTYKLVDGLMYKDQILDELNDRLGNDKDDKVNAITLEKYFKKAVKRGKLTGDKIAVLYAEGNIVNGQGETGNIGGERYAKMIRKIRKDKKVKALVLRVNSGGGSSLASENIWRELIKAKEQDIKLVVSMGDFAASGGYYIACEAEKIFAEPNTITGSIGVFGMLPNVEEFLDDQLGIDFDTVKTSKFATTGSPMFELNDMERAIFQQGIDSVYIKFKQRVAAGRDFSMEKVETMAQGRVWTGTQAKELGLIDELGGLEDALAHAAELAELDGYRTVEYPKTKTKMEELVEKLTGKKPLDVMMKQELGDYYEYYDQAKQMKEMTGIQMRMPYEIKIQ